MSSNTPSSTTSAPTTEAGAAIYSMIGTKYFYDWFVLGFSNSFAWCCPTVSTQVPFFNKNIKPHSHLDIGVGTGYYLTQAKLPPGSNITLCDLNANSLAMAKSSTETAFPDADITVRTIQHDIEKDLPPGPNGAPQNFDSISLMFLLHCMPGPPSRKTAIFKHLARNNLSNDGVLFGTTILAKRVTHNWVGNFLIDLYNKKGIFGNADDGAEEILNGLKEAFDDVDAKVVGRVLMFEGRRPKKS